MAQVTKTAKLTEGQRFANNYRLLHRLCANKSTEVWRAVHHSSGTPVVIKMFKSDRSLDPVVIQLLSEEFSSATLKHPNVLAPLDFDVAEDIPVIIMPFQERGSLQDRLQSDRVDALLSETEAVALVSDISGALSFFHKKNFVHQDLTSSNVMIDVDGKFLLTDFGISRILHNTLSHTVGPNRIYHPAYASPERYMNPSANPADW